MPKGEVEKDFVKKMVNFLFGCYYYPQRSRDATKAINLPFAHIKRGQGKEKVQIISRTQKNSLVPTRRPALWSPREYGLQFSQRSLAITFSYFFGLPSLAYIELSVIENFSLAFETVA